MCCYWTIGETRAASLVSEWHVALFLLGRKAAKPALLCRSRNPDSVQGMAGRCCGKHPAPPKPITTTGNQKVAYLQQGTRVCFKLLQTLLDALISRFAVVENLS